MAERRMFAKTIIDSDAFLDMPMSARLLYYDLAMRADDDGFINSPKKIMRFVGASIDDLNILAIRKFIIPFDNGVVVIKHWRIHNYIRKDRYSETTYSEEKSLLEVDENRAYRLISDEKNSEKMPTVNQRSTSGRPLVDAGKDRLGKDRLNREGDQDPERKRSTTARFIKPTVEEVRAYCRERNNNVDAERFVDYYEANGWKVGKSSMKDWKATVRNWERRDKDGRQTSKGTDKNKDRAGAIDLSHIGTVI